MLLFRSPQHATHQITTTLVAMPMLFFGAAEITMNPPMSMIESIIRLGYPLYVFRILGIASVMGAAALLLGRNSSVKEWAYAGFTFLFMGAAASHAFSLDFTGMIAPAAMLLLLGASYISGKWHSLTETNRLRSQLQAAALPVFRS